MRLQGVMREGGEGRGVEGEEGRECRICGLTKVKNKGFQGFPLQYLHVK